MKKIFNFRFFPILTAVVIAAVLLSAAVWKSIILIILLLIAGLAGLVLSIIFHKKLKKYLLPAYPVAFLVLTVLTIGYIHSGQYNNYSAYEAAVIRITYVTEDKKIMYGDIETPGGQSGKAKLVFTLFTAYEDIKTGDIITVYADIRAVRPLRYDGTADYDYNARNIRYECNIKEIIDFETSPLTITENVYEYLKEKLDVIGAEKGIALALLTGDKYYIDQDLYEAYKIAGISHILVVSGLHVSVFAGAIIMLLKKLKVKPFVRLLTVGSVLFLYMALCNFAPSINRAFIMTLVYLAADCIGRQKDMLSSICFAAVIILLLNPMNLFNVGFLMSFAAVAGIALLNPPLSRFFGKYIKFIPKTIRDTMTISIAVNIMLFPILAYYFGTFSTYFLIANILVLPLMSLGFIALVTGAAISIIPFMAWTLIPAQYFIKYMNFISITFAGMPFSVIPLIPLFGAAILYYTDTIIISDFIFMSRRNKFLLFTFLATAGAFIIFSLLLIMR